MRDVRALAGNRESVETAHTGSSRYQHESERTPLGKSCEVLRFRCAPPQQVSHSITRQAQHVESVQCISAFAHTRLDRATISARSTRTPAINWRPSWPSFGRDWPEARDASTSPRIRTSRDLRPPWHRRASTSLERGKGEACCWCRSRAATPPRVGSIQIRPSRPCGRRPSGLWTRASPASGAQVTRRGPSGARSIWTS